MFDRYQPEPHQEAAGGLPPGPPLDDRLLDLLPTAVYVCDAAGRIVRYNKSAARLWGRSPRPGDSDERFCGAHRLFRANGEPLAHRDTPMADAIATGRPHRDAVVQIEQPGGRRLWALVSIDPIFDDQGRIAGAVNCFQDVTDRIEAEARLEESRALLGAVIEATPECVKIVARDGTLLRMNAAGLRMIGADSAADVEGGSTVGLIAPEDRERWRQQHERVCGGESLTWEFTILGRDGARREMETHAVPLRMPNGAVAQLAITRDVSQRRAADRVIRESEQRLRQLLDALPTAVYTTDARGYVTFFNEACVQMAGRRPEIWADRWCITHTLYSPDGTPLPFEDCPMAVAITQNRAIAGAEILAGRPDGTRVPALAYPTPLRDPEGRVVGAVNMLVDISERKSAEERRQLLINELNHRVKNTLATVQSIAYQSFQGEAKSKSHEWFQGRLFALASAHDVLTREDWKGADLRDIVAATTAPLTTPERSPFDVEGPELRLRPKAAVPLAMALHELCTNAAKYGALSNGVGRVGIAWEVDEAGPDRLLRLRWAERGGPPVEVPQRRGFGSRLIERGLPHELHARVRLEHRREGVTCAIDMPLP